MATHSTILAWEIPRTEEPGRLQSFRSQRIRRNRGTEHPYAKTPGWVQLGQVGPFESSYLGGSSGKVPPAWMPPPSFILHSLEKTGSTEWWLGSGGPECLHLNPVLVPE